MLLAFVAFSLLTPAFGAENLRMRDGVSYFSDLDKGFPIVGEKMDDVAVSTTTPTFLFFGAAGDMNTNRQAKRVVDLYKKYKGSNVKFIVIDVDHALSPPAKALIKAHYTGYIPGEVVFDKTGKQKWTHAGETETSVVAAQLDKVLAP
jgi:hypothetical protein